MVVSLDNGDILKCNIEDALKTINADQKPGDNEAPRIYRPLLNIQVTGVTSLP